MVKVVEPPHRGTARTIAQLLTVGVAGALLAGCGSSVAGPTPPPTGTGGQLTPLRLGEAQTGSETTGRGRPTLAVELPTGPGVAPVYRFTGGVDEAAVGRLAAALGISGTPERRAHGWAIGGNGSRAGLVVRDDGIGAWAYSSDTSACGLAVDADSTDDDSSVSCSAAAPPGGALGPSSARATAAAEPLLAAVGLADASPQVTVSTGATYVRVDPVIDGLRTTGVATSVTVTGDSVSAAQGVLAGTARGPDYPIVSAKAAYASLSSLPQPEIAISCPDHEDGAPLTGLCARQVVTGAEVGLTLRSDDGKPVLVPAWLFLTKDGPPLTMIAVADRFLARR